MPNYSYKALLPNGNTEKGIITESSERAARLELISRNLTPLTLKETLKTKKNSPKVKTSNLSLLFRQLSAYLSTGTNLDKAFLLSAKSTNNNALKEILGSIHEGLIKGDSLQKCLESFPSVFNAQTIGIINAGENSGNLEYSFQYLADYLDTVASTRKKVLSSLSYPIFLLLFSGLIIASLLIFVLPQITNQFISSGIELPGITKIMMFISSNFFFMFLAVVLLVFFGMRLFHQFLQSPANKTKFDYHSIKLPILGSLILSYELEKFSQAMLIMLRSGLNFDQSFVQAMTSFSNSYLFSQFSSSCQMVQDGKDFMKPLIEIPKIPTLFIQLFESGYQTGTFDRSFEKICVHLNEDIEARRNVFLSILEPIMIVFMGIFVLLIVLAILTPMMQMNSLILQ
jgi:general secretion pathway protein F